MNVIFHTASLLCRVPTRSKTMALDDLHKFAWKTFTGGQHLPGDRTRPFAFRAEAIGADRVLLTLRSDVAFPGSRPCRISVDAGQVIPVFYHFVPARRIGSKAYTAPSEQWSEIGCRNLERAGLLFEQEPAVELVGRWKVKPNMSGPITLAQIRGEGRIDDPQAFALAYLDGVGRKRGYGAGLIVSPGLEQQQSRAA